MKIFSFWLTKGYYFNRGNNKGTTLIEVMLALLIIALVILGGGMFFFYGRVNIMREAHRRAALLVASQRLEALKAANWDDIAPEAGEESGGYIFNPLFRYYLLYNPTWSWLQPAISEDDPPEDVKETVTVDNLPDGKRTTEAQWQDAAADGIDSYDYLQITITVEWGDNITNRVSLTTRIAPH